MSRVLKRGKQASPVVSDGAKKVIVAVKASKEIPKTALTWALTHVVHPGDCITLIVVVPSHNSGMLIQKPSQWFLSVYTYLLSDEMCRKKALEFPYVCWRLCK